MASSLGIMTINDTEIKPHNVNHNEPLQDKISTDKAQKLIQDLHTSNILYDDDEDNMHMADFENIEDNKNFSNDIANDNSYINQYYNEYISQPHQQQNVESELMTKVNYMIRLLEENNDEKINNVNEEMILYCFLGVFMILMVDSFSRVGKYVR